MEMGQCHACGRGMDITKCHLCLLQPSHCTINTQWHFIVFHSCYKRILLLKVCTLPNNAGYQEKLGSNLLIEMWIFFCCSYFPTQYRLIGTEKATTKKLCYSTCQIETHSEDLKHCQLSICTSVSQNRDNVKKDWGCFSPKGQFILMSSAPITKSARGHEGGCLSKLV